MTARIPLSAGFVALVDDADQERVLAEGKWSASNKGKVVYALRSVPRAGEAPTTIRLHNFLTGWRFVDHINGDGLDNRRANLRPAAQGSNGANVGPRSHNTSGYKGVTWHKGAGKWCAQIRAGGKQYYLGLFADPVDAARAYDAAARDHHGAFARTNFPEVTA